MLLFVSFLIPGDALAVQYSLMSVGEVGIDRADIGVLYSDGEWRIPHVFFILVVTGMFRSDRGVTPLCFNSTSMWPR